VSPEARALARTFDALAPREREMLAAFAAFLEARAEAPPLAPVVTLRPEGEGVLQAVRRLKRSYPMLARRPLMQPVGALVSAHMLDGRPAGQTIDALEALFAASWREHTAASEGER
jgi:hypothetical protein